MNIETIRREIQGGLVLIGLIWLVFLVDSLSAYDFRDYGIQPRSVSGLLGLVTAPFLHRDLWHLAGNTVPLFVLLCLLAGSRAPTVPVVIAIAVVGGLLLWLVGPSETNNIGASGLVFGLMAYLIAAGLFERRPLSILISLLVGMIYGTTLVWGIMPGIDPSVSWQGHFLSAVAGVAIAYLASRPRRATGQSIDWFQDQQLTLGDPEQRE